ASRAVPGKVELEIPEAAAVADLEQTTRTLAAIRDLGVRVTLQGFGTGTSSLTTLQRLPVDAVKLAGTWTRSLGSDPRAATVVQAVLSLASALHLATYAD